MRFLEGRRGVVGVLVVALAAAAIGVVVSLGVAQAHAGTQSRSANYSKQCSQPASQRTGGWMCPTATSGARVAHTH